MLKNIYSKLLTLLFLFSFCLAATVNAAPIKVKAVKGGGSGEIQFEVAAPISYIRQVISNDQLFMPLIPGIQKWKMIGQEGDAQIAQCTMAMSGLMKPATYKVKLTQPSKDEVKFKRISGDLKDLEGSWKIKAVDQKESITQITYNYRIDTGMNLIPKLVIEKELKNHLQETQRKVISKIPQMYKTQIPQPK